MLSLACVRLRAQLQRIARGTKGWANTLSTALIRSAKSLKTTLTQGDGPLHLFEFVGKGASLETMPTRHRTWKDPKWAALGSFRRRCSSGRYLSTHHRVLRARQYCNTYHSPYPSCTYRHLCMHQDQHNSLCAQRWLGSSIMESLAPRMSARLERELLF
jgi:hypothetical protein